MQTLPSPPPLDPEHLDKVIARLKREKFEHNMVVALGGGLAAGVLARWLSGGSDLVAVGTAFGWCLGVVAKHCGL